MNLTHDANAANHTGADIANAFAATTVVTSGNGNAAFRVGADVGDDISLAFQDMRSSALGNANKPDLLIPDNDAVSTVTKANTLLQATDSAMAQVSLFRAKLGAVQNQMDTAVNSLAVSVENLSASQSRVRAADIAEVSSKMVAQQIMQQAGVAVLAQAADGERLLIADLRGRALVILDPMRPDAARRIPVSGGPHEVLRLPDGRVAVSLEQAGAMAVVDLDSGGVETIATGGLPHGLALQRDAEGDRLLVTDREHDSLRRFVIGGPAVTWREVALTHMSGWPHAVVARDDGTFAVARARDAVLQIGGREMGVSSLPETVALSPDQARVDATVGGRTVRTIFSPDGSLVAAALSAASGVALVDREGGVRTVQRGGDVGRPRVLCGRDTAVCGGHGRWSRDHGRGGLGTHTGDLLGRDIRGQPAGAASREVAPQSDACATIAAHSFLLRTEPRDDGSRGHLLVRRGILAPRLRARVRGTLRLLRGAVLHRPRLAERRLLPGLQPQALPREVRGHRGPSAVAGRAPAAYPDVDVRGGRLPGADAALLPALLAPVLRHAPHRQGCDGVPPRRPRAHGAVDVPALRGAPSALGLAVARLELV